MIRRLLRSRGMVKFRKNRLALAASGVIALYGAIFLAIISMEIYDGVAQAFGGEAKFALREGTRIRVLPRQNPGFLEARTPSERYNDLRWHHQRMERIFDRDLEGMDDPWVQALSELDLAERKIPRGELAEVRARWGAFDEAFLVLDELYLDRDDVLDLVGAIRYEIDELRGDLAGAEPAARTELEAEIAALEEELAPELEYLNELEPEFFAQEDATEAALRELMPMPTGWGGVKYGFRTFLGSDVSGRSISCRAFYSIKVAFQIGFVVAGISVLIGTVLGAAGAFYAGWVDAIVMWLVTTLSSVPYLVLLVVLAYMFTGSQLFDNPREYPELQLVKLYTAMGLAFWIGTARVIRGEVMKIKELEYVQAATAIGFGRVYILLRHVVPNTAHIMFINFSLLFIGAIKSEVILSFLGLGVSGQPSWGTMISLAKDDLSNYFFWEIGSASFLLFVLVLAFNIVSDALQDAFDPRHVS
ncbi:MAG: ABC transporter permease [Phycisphaerales bacterium JB040]